MAKEIPNQNHSQGAQNQGIYYACAACGRWQRASSAAPELKCKSCGQREKMPESASDSRPPFSRFDATLREYNLGLTTGRFQCLCPECGRRYEFPLSLEGGRLLCRKCRTAFRAKSFMEDHDESPGESAPGPVRNKAGATPAVQTGQSGPYGRVCAYDHTPIEADDEWIQCPSCGLPYHKECWEENFGCAALGCDMVDALKPKEDRDQSPAGQEDAEPLPPPPPPREKRREPMWMAISAAAVLPGLLTFGLPNLLMCGITVFLMARRKPGTHYGWLFLAFLVSFTAFWGGFWCTLHLFGG